MTTPPDTTDTADRAGVVGAGLTGSLLAIRLARRGIPVDLYDRRPDLRINDVDQGRSINLALSTRGLDAMARVGLAEIVQRSGVPMRGRMIHHRDAELRFQPYGTRPEHHLLSVSRDGLNIALLDAVDREPLVRTHFSARVRDVDLHSTSLILENGENSSSVPHEVVYGADGAYSAVRSRLQRTDRFSYEQAYLEHGYKELTIRPDATGGFRMEPNALHIWPRGSHMLIALPNADGTFTCTLFWPFEGDVGFDRIDTDDEILAVFEEQFPDALELMDDLAEQYRTNPTSSIVTVTCRPWHRGAEILLLGDACHAVVPFYGQGANAALEDVTVLMDCLDEHADRAAAFEAFFTRRKPDTDALAELAVDNFEEMRSRVASPVFLVQKRLERALARLFPGRFDPLYTMVTFSRRPYAESVARAQANDTLVRRLAITVLVLLLALLALVVVILVR